MLNKLSDAFSPEESFLKLRIVKNTIRIFLMISISITVVILFNGRDSLYLDLSYSGFNYSLTVFRVPLGLLAVLITTLAFYSSKHKSEQTFLQIKLTQEQNVFSNFYKHQEEFIKYLNEEKVKEYILDKRLCHRNIYNGAKIGEYSPSVEVYKCLDQACIDWINSMILVYQNIETSSSTSLICIQVKLHSLFSFYLYLNEDKFPQVHTYIDNGYNEIVITTIIQLQKYLDIYRDILVFDADAEVLKKNTLRVEDAEHFDTFEGQINKALDVKSKDGLAHKLLCEMRDSIG